MLRPGMNACCGCMRSDTKLDGGPARQKAARCAGGGSGGGGQSLSCGKSCSRHLTAFRAGWQGRRCGCAGPSHTISASAPPASHLVQPHNRAHALVELLQVAAGCSAERVGWWRAVGSRRWAPGHAAHCFPQGGWRHPQPAPFRGAGGYDAVRRYAKGWDRERGVVWEESIIMLPHKVRPEWTKWVEYKRVGLSELRSGP